MRPAVLVRTLSSLQRIQLELARSSKRVYLMEPKVLKGHYVATDNAIVLVAICASLGVAVGVLGGAALLKPKSAA